MNTQQHSVTVRRNGELLVVEALRSGAIRVRSTPNRELSGEAWALAGMTVEEAGTVRVAAAHTGESAITVTEANTGATAHTVTSGNLEARIDPAGRIAFYDRTDGRIIVEEAKPVRAWARNGRRFSEGSGDAWTCRAWFEAQEGEAFYGLGQHQNGRLDQKGCVIDLEQKNTEITIPFFVSSNGYGFLWNCPAVGRVELAENGTRWFASRAREIDYVVILGATNAAIMENYFALTGYPPPAPHWATGFWQSKLRYSSQEELLGVAREYRRRKLPLSVIVADYFHWTAMGDWRFDSEFWPDPKAMADELSAMGVTLAVSIWPSVNPDSENFDEMKERGILVRSETGPANFYVFEDTGSKKKVALGYYDSTNPEGRAYLWEKAKKNYFDTGSRCFWLDACEPEIQPYDPGNLRMHLGSGLEVGNVYPYLHEQAFFDGMTAAGEKRIMNLCRSAWAGSQRFGTLVWSGDVDSSFTALARQIPAGLGMAMSGIPWWTTDIGGFFGGTIEDPSFRELLVRWFEFGVFCPVTRIHGFRNSWDAKKGSDNEPWSFGEDVYFILSKLLTLRESLRPHIEAFAETELARGRPFMRPLFFDFPADPAVAQVKDEYLFIDTLLVAPVVEADSRRRTVIFPAGADWIDPWTSMCYRGGTETSVDAPLDRIPVFVKDGSKLLGEVDWK